MENCNATPLVDLLEGIPADARLIYEHSPTHHQSIPVGVEAHAAAARIRGLEAENDALRDELAAANNLVTSYGERAGKAEADLTAAKAERDDLLRDRYLWLREKATINAERDTLRSLLREAQVNMRECAYTSDLDSRIDAALAKGE